MDTPPYANQQLLLSTTGQEEGEPEDPIDVTTPPNGHLILEPSNVNETETISMIDVPLDTPLDTPLETVQTTVSSHSSEELHSRPRPLPSDVR